MLVKDKTKIAECGQWLTHFFGPGQQGKFAGQRLSYTTNHNQASTASVTGECMEEVDHLVVH